MFAGGLLLAGTLLFFAFWLQWTENHGWPHDSFTGKDDQEYLAQRKKSRRLVNILIGLCGALIAVATFAGVGLVFVAAWSIVTITLMVILVLAALDAFRTHRHHRRKLRQQRE
ncbi:EscU/YscU/HrcU family type III secretion system export apparatus switch protein [Roseiconus nitratireducens]|uniref:EscU/YscU/HrcU family type III secretion system export apparatus switch protein n=1 Tax=Roseiconus nitratireducens TaxID=2605748 RepID=A0A5M6DI04_9BACT|nr:EscU/YscU/HrcU family type III secretion system export apparatus switch protein [Roseiconus nitratireducens]KAA5547188.1 EscU/YscU/HrcU family type III secretion system export apparatus switch protein [Roseiconus nitratireducens]